MVFFTGVAVLTVATGGAGAIAGAAIGSSAGTAAATAGTATALGTAAGVGTAGGAIAGAGAGALAGAAGGSLAGATAGAVAGGSAAVGVGSTGAGAGALAAGALSGPVGWLAVGATENADGGRATYDCWKPVIHDTSEELSSGIALRDLVSHQNIANVVITPGIPTGLPHIILENIWNEKFEIEYLIIQNTGKCVCHAKPVCV